MCDQMAKVDNGDSTEFRYSRTSLSWAGQYGHDAVVKLLLDSRKANVDSRDKYGWTPLSWATSNGHDAVVKLLLDPRKVDVDSED
jgi:ankyrin repeat protein